jgi:hypothetical protein
MFRMTRLCALGCRADVACLTCAPLRRSCFSSCLRWEGPFSLVARQGLLEGLGVPSASARGRSVKLNRGLRIRAVLGLPAFPPRPPSPMAASPEWLELLTKRAIDPRIVEFLTTNKVLSIGNFANYVAVHLVRLLCYAVARHNAKISCRPSAPSRSATSTSCASSRRSLNSSRDKNVARCSSSSRTSSSKTAGCPPLSQCANKL